MRGKRPELSISTAYAVPTIIWSRDIRMEVHLWPSITLSMRWSLDFVPVSSVWRETAVSFEALHMWVVAMARASLRRKHQDNKETAKAADSEAHYVCYSNTVSSFIAWFSIWSGYKHCIWHPGPHRNIGKVFLWALPQALPFTRITKANNI